MGDGQRGIGRERLTERRRGFGILELLEQSHAEVVRAVGVFALRIRDGLKAVPYTVLATRRARDDEQNTCNHEGTKTRRRPRAFHGRRLMGAVRTIPPPSFIVTTWLALSVPTESTRPLGQVILTPSTAVTLPRPKVSGSSLCEA